MAGSKPSIHVGVDARGLTNLYRDLNAAGKEIASELLVDLKQASEPVKDDAVAAAEQFSTRIPGTIKLVSRGGRAHVSIAVKAGGKDAPHAYVYEVGSGRNAGKIRHPLNWPNERKANAWATQKTGPFPYLLPALRKNLDNIAARVTAAVDKHLKNHRL